MLIVRQQGPPVGRRARRHTDDSLGLRAEEASPPRSDAPRGPRRLDEYVRDKKPDFAPHFACTRPCSTFCQHKHLLRILPAQAFAPHFASTSLKTASAPCISGPVQSATASAFCYSRPVRSFALAYALDLDPGQSVTRYARTPRTSWALLRICTWSQDDLGRRGSRGFCGARADLGEYGKNRSESGVDYGQNPPATGTAIAWLHSLAVQRRGSGF